MRTGHGGADKRMENQYWREGYEAALAGKQFNVDCPYIFARHDEKSGPYDDACSERRNQWFDGWNYARNHERAPDRPVFREGLGREG